MDSIGGRQFPATILSGQSLSGSIAMGADRLVGVLMPAAWDAAALTFQASVDGVTWLELMDSAGAAISFTAAAGQAIMPLLIPYNGWLGFNLLKIRSGTSGVPVNQTANRVLTVVGWHRPY